MGPLHHFYGKHLSEEHKKRLSLAHKGIKLIEQHKHRISLGQIFRWKRRKEKENV
jgi:NUMOD3 motif